MWDYVPIKSLHTGHVAAWNVLDMSALNKTCRSCGPESTRSPLGARAQMGAIDRISEHRTPQINRESDASWGDMWTHRDASIEIVRAKGREIVDRVMGHDSIDFA